MAKRKRLTPPAAEDVARAPEVKGMFTDAPVGVVPAQVRNRLSAGAAPIADMAGAAAAQSALEEVSAELSSIRAEGRLIQKLRTSQIDPGHLMRDRVVIDEEDLATLMTSLRNRGQQTPIEVIETAPGRYGLISGWRRLAALGRLYEETGEAQFAHVQALVRTALSAQDAYVAMVEENEVRVGLSYYERAQIVARTVEAGVYPSAKKALQTLFASASRAKRSKIKSFLPIVEALGPLLSHPAAIGERMGLELAQQLENAGVKQSLTKALETQLDAEGTPTAEAEQALIAAVLEGAAPASAEVPKPPAPEGPKGEDIAPGIRMVEGKSSLSLIGPGVTGEVIARIREMLSAR